MILVGLDPSFSCAGVSVMNTEKKLIRISDARTKIGKKSFENVFWASTRVHQDVRKIIDSVGKPNILMSEKPYAGGRFSSGLHTLDATLFYDYIHRYDSLDRVYLMTASFLRHVHSENGIKKYKKSDSTNLVREQLLPTFEENNWDIEYGCKFSEKGEFKGGLNNNTAESFIFLTGLVVSLNDEFGFIEEKMMDDLYHVAKGLFNKKEELLFKRSQLLENDVS